jgi:hypothetical protein
MPDPQLIHTPTSTGTRGKVGGQGADQLQRRAVRPMEVLQHDHRARTGQRTEVVGEEEGRVVAERARVPFGVVAGLACAVR